jgi:hypothetical protein
MAPTAYTCIVDQHVKAAEAADHRIEQAPALGRLGHICRYGHGFVPVAGELRDEDIERSGGTGRQSDAGSGSGSPVGQRPADAAGSAGD